MKTLDVINSLVTNKQDLADYILNVLQTVHTLTAKVASDEGEAPDACVIESTIQNATNRLACAGIGHVLSAFEPETDLVELHGVTYKRAKETSQGKYFARCGNVKVQRHLYREVGVRNGPTIVPLELRAGIVRGPWLPLAASAGAHLLQSEPSRDAFNTCKALGIMPFSRSALERIAGELGGQWDEHHLEGEDFLADNLVIPDDATAISVSVDRVSLPMVEFIYDKSGNRTLSDKGRPLFEVKYRMAFCGVWTLYDAKGEPLLSTRYGRMPHEGHAPIEEILRGDVAAILETHPELTLVGLADGAPEMQQILRRIFQAVGRPSAPIVLDFWHLMEKLSAAIKAAGQDLSENQLEVQEIA